MFFKRHINEKKGQSTDQEKISDKGFVSRYIKNSCNGVTRKHAIHFFLMVKRFEQIQVNEKIKVTSNQGNANKNYNEMQLHRPY